jgi:hypothetical protein
MVFLAQLREGKEKNMRRERRSVAREIDRPATVMWVIVERKLTSTKSRQLV